MRTALIFILLLTGLFLPASAQNFKADFNRLISKKDTAAAAKVLADWKAAKPDDAELYVGYFNYYVQKSKTEVIQLGDKPKGEDALRIMDPDSTNRAPVGYMYGGVFYDPVVLDSGFAYVDAGIAKFPTRLDMRFGKIYMLGETQNYESFTREIIKTIDFSATIENKWTWTNNEPLGNDAEKTMLTSIHDYVVQLYNTEDDSLLDNMRRISEAVLKYYPKHVESLSNISITYMVSADFDKALTYLLRAEKAAPKDYIVLANIAHCYLEKGDTKKAIKYYELTAKYGDEPRKAYANEKLQELRKK